jgi:hypothetical protein
MNDGEQLALELDGPTTPAANPNAHLFDAAGNPRRLLWCSDTVRSPGTPAPTHRARISASVRDSGQPAAAARTSPHEPRKG